MSEKTCQNLPADQARFLEACLTSPSIAAAAKTAKVPERTAYRWTAEDAAFRAAYRQAKRGVIDQAVMLMSAGVGGAIATLLKICADSAQPASARVAAAGKIIDATFRALELDDFAARLEALEGRALSPVPVNEHVDL